MKSQGSTAVSRRGLLLGSAGLASAAVLSGCVGGGGEPAPGTSAEGSAGASESAEVIREVVLQSNMENEGPKQALADVVAGQSDYDVTINTVATSQFRAQLPSYLTSTEAPDLLTWYAGSVTNGFAAEGLLHDVSDVWTNGNASGFSDALKDLSTYEGKQYFIPTNYYWWAIFFRKSSFEKWGVQVPETWDDFIGVMDNLKSQGVHPLTTGLGNNAWMTAAWFDYLNLRVNGADFHRELLRGEHSFDGDEVREVMKYYAQILPYFHPNSKSWSPQEAAAPIAREEAAMYLIGTFGTPYWPEDQQDDLDFFPVPVIDPSIPSAAEAPTDGFMVPSNAKNPAGGMALADYLASPEAQQEFIEKAESPNLPTHPDVDASQFSPLIQKGLEMLNNTEQVTQFFNRDSSDELQGAADEALMRFIDNPDDVDNILKNWQQAAEQVFSQ